MQKFAIIDIGSNSMRMLIIAMNNKSFRVLDEVKETVRLGKDMHLNYLNPDRMEKAFKTLKFFKSLCDAQEINNIRIVATEAVRKAKNQKEFLNYIKENLNLDIQVLTGKEEAYYDYFGTVNTLEVSSALLMDIGGSSTEFILMKDRKIEESISIPIGAINLTENFSLDTLIDDEKELKMDDFLSDKLADITWLKEATGLPLIGIGGSLRNIAKIHSKRENYPLDILHNYELKASDINDIYKHISSLDVNQRKKVKGLSKDRIDVFLGPLALITKVLNSYDIENVIISGSGIREGLLFEHMLKDNIVESVLDASLENHLELYDINKVHASNVLKLSSSLLKELSPIFKSSKSSSKVLKVASLLHDCGVRINYYQNHELALQILLKSKINGLSHKEIVMSAYTAAYFNKNDLKISEKNLDKLLSKEDVDTINKLRILLRIAKNLDRAMDGNIEALKCDISLDEVYIKVKSKKDPSLEILSALDCSQLFRKTFDKKLIIA
ncbi:exopolyphosphatase [Clostridium intestinale]|uniref:Exopolyphosphatase n=1 Tax=Clostridium intestinale TaxID=36845 RepID=A0A7D6VTT6_9CLOT|nr:exopolyphosphatase [Clostridium intestinale]QLY79770.1 exopolyphosphatase [Clostridium intestinale]